MFDGLAMLLFTTSYYEYTCITSILDLARFEKQTQAISGRRKVHRKLQSKFRVLNILQQMLMFLLGVCRGQGFFIPADMYWCACARYVGVGWGTCPV